MTKNEDLKPTTVYEELFSLVESQTGKVLLQSEMNDIINVVEKYSDRPTVTPTDGDAEGATTEGYSVARKALNELLHEAERLRGEKFRTSARNHSNYELIRAALQSTRKPPTLILEEAVTREDTGIPCSLHDGCTPTSSTTDGDAERALEAVQAWFDSIEWTEETGKPFKYKDSEEVLYKHGRTIRTALQSTRKPPVDTLNIKREVLMGVIGELNKIKMLRKRADAAVGFVDSPYPRALNAAVELTENILASLDTVLSEGG